VAGGATAAVLAGRLRWYPILLACAIIDLGLVWLLDAQPSEWLFYLDAAAFGFIWLFILPIQVPMLIQADPSRRSAMLNSGVSLLGGSVGPSIAAELITQEDMLPALWFAAGCLIVCILIATALRLMVRARAA
jgi:hypothetical protein